MKTLDLEKLPPFAQEELLDFYEFLLKKYVPSEFDPHMSMAIYFDPVLANKIDPPDALVG